MKPISLDAMAASVPDGALIALPPDNSLPSVALAMALIRRGAKRAAAAGGACQRLRHRYPDRRRLRGRGADFGGVAWARPGSRRASRRRCGRAPSQVRDATCPAIHTMLQAAEKGVPFIPLRGLIGSDILVNRPDWVVQQNPIRAGGRCDRAAPCPVAGCCRFPCRDGRQRTAMSGSGRRRECATLAHASQRALVTVERVVEGNFLEDEQMAAGTISTRPISATSPLPSAARGRRRCWMSMVSMRLYVSDYARAAED